MKQTKKFPRTNLDHCSTPKNISINQNLKLINYNISSNNNHNFTKNNFYNANLSFSNKNQLKESDGSSDNSSDINYYSGSNSLKDQILSPGDDDLYLYVNDNKNEYLYRIFVLLY